MTEEMKSRICIHCDKLEPKRFLERYGCLNEDEPGDYVVWLHVKCFQDYCYKWARRQIAMEDAIKELKTDTKQ